MINTHLHLFFCFATISNYFCPSSRTIQRLRTFWQNPKASPENVWHTSTNCAKGRTFVKVGRKWTTNLAWNSKRLRRTSQRRRYVANVLQSDFNHPWLALFGVLESTPCCKTSTGSRRLRTIPAAHQTLWLGAVRRVETRQWRFTGEENPAEPRACTRDLQAHLGWRGHHLGNGPQVCSSRVDDCHRVACPTTGCPTSSCHAGICTQPGNVMENPKNPFSSGALSFSLFSGAKCINEWTMTFVFSRMTWPTNLLILWKSTTSSEEMSRAVLQLTSSLRMSSFFSFT